MYLLTDARGSSYAGRTATLRLGTHARSGGSHSISASWQGTTLICNVCIVLRSHSLIIPTCRSGRASVGGTRERVVIVRARGLISPPARMSCPSPAEQPCRCSPSPVVFTLIQSDSQAQASRHTKVDGRRREPRSLNGQYAVPS